MNTSVFPPHKVILERYCKILTGYLHRLFNQRWRELMNTDWIVNETTQSYFKEGNGKSLYNSLFDSQRKSLFNQPMEEWDFSLIVKLLRSKPFQYKQFNRTFEQIGKVRNDLAHFDNNKSDVEQKDFIHYSDILFQCANQLGFTLEPISVDMILKEQSTYVPPKVKELRDQAKSLIEQKQYAQALGLYQEALEIEQGIKSKAILLVNQAIVYWKLYNEKSESRYLDRIEQTTQQAITYDNTNFKGYYYLIRVYQIRNQTDKVLVNIDLALAIEPGNTELKEIRDQIISTRSILNRKEHLDPSKAPIDLSETRQNVVNSLLPNLSDKQIREMEKIYRIMEDQQVPGAADVVRGHQYRFGDPVNGIRINHIMALKHYQIAANRGNAEGMYNLAQMYHNGFGTDINIAEAVKWYQQTTMQPPLITKLGSTFPNLGVREAFHALGNMYNDGTYFDRSHQMAIRYYNKSLELVPNYIKYLGQALGGDSANNLGLIYWNGDGGNKDIVKAIHFFQLGHKYGDYQAAENLANLYIQEYRDAELAQLWHNQALKSGSGFAQEMNVSMSVMIQAVQQEFEQSGVIEWEQSKGLGSDGLKYQERILRMFNHQIGDIQLPSIPRPITTPEVGDHVTHPDNIGILVNAIEKGSQHAEHLLTIMERNIDAANHIINGELAQGLDLLYLNTLDQPERHMYLAECVPPLKQYCSNLISSPSTSTETDIKARSIYARLISTEPDKTIPFLDQCIKKYPDNSEFWLYRGYMNCFKQNFIEAIGNFVKALSLNPTRYRIHYDLAATYHILIDQNTDYYKQALYHYQLYLSQAQPDEDRISQSYYVITLITMMYDRDNKTKIKEYYNKAVQAESRQLPVYRKIVEEFPARKTVRNLISIMDRLDING